MTVIDLAVIAAGSFVAVLLYKHRSIFAASDNVKNLFVIAIGALLIAGFYCIDLYTMWVLPHIVGMKEAMATMTYLHQNLFWITNTLGFGAVSVGLAFGIRSNASLIGKLEFNEQELLKNITELKKTEARYRDLIADSQFGIRIERPGAKRIFANKTCASMFGYESVAEYLREQGAPGTMIAPYDRERLLKNFSARQQGKPALSEYEYDSLTKSGSILPVQVFVREIIWEGEPALLRTFIDISNRRTAENEARESQEQYRRLIETIPDAIYVQIDGKIDYANPAAGKNFGAVNTRQLIGMSSIELFHPEHHDAVRERRKISARSSMPLPMIDVKHRRLDGSDFYGQTSGAGIKWNGQKAVLVVVRDISERKETEQSLANAREAADAANRSKSTFLATMSHEIRTPMNGVLGMADLLGRMDLTVQQHDFVQTIRESGRSLLDLLNDILDLSKIEAGCVELETVEFSVAELLAGTNALWAQSARGKGLVFAVHNNLTDTDVVRSDHRRLRQVLYNLVGNALKFTSDGSIEIFAEAFPATEGRIELRIEIKDTGIGVSEQQKEKLFQPFAQADSSTTRQYGGTGLGLTISRNLVELLGGEIGFESVPDKGSTFWFTVPVERVSADKRQPVLAKETLGVPSGGSSEQPLLRILIAEDNDINQKIVSFLLAPLNCQFDIVENGLEAVAAVTRSHYDLVLMNIQMPKMDGIAATKQIRSLAGPNGQIPIIAITANVMLGDRERYLAIGMNDYVAKPIDQIDLISAVARHAGIPMPDIDAIAGTPPVTVDTAVQPIADKI